MARRAETTGRTLSDELHVDDENDNNYKQNKTQMVKKERLKKNYNTGQDAHFQGMSSLLSYEHYKRK